MTDITGNALERRFGGQPRRAFSPVGMRLPPLLRLMRPHQWVKNAFVAAPLFFTPSAVSMVNVGLTLAGIVSFCLISSAVYILNDIMDREADRAHPTKRGRPLACGAVPLRAAIGLLVLALAAGLSLAAWLSPTFTALALVYFCVNVAYSSVLKHISIVDVLTITLGFVLRVLAGAALIEAEPSVWILMCTGLVAHFLALAKRRDDLAKSLDAQHRAALAGYTKPFLDVAISVTLGALLIAYIMYTTDVEVAARLETDYLHATVPFVMAGILRYLQITLVEERSGAPTAMVLTDRFMITCMGLWLATFALLIYA